MKLNYFVEIIKKRLTIFFVVLGFGLIGGRGTVLIDQKKLYVSFCFRYQFKINLKKKHTTQVVLLFSEISTAITNKHTSLK